MARAMLRPSRVCLLVPCVSDRVSWRARVLEQRAHLLFFYRRLGRLSAVTVFVMLPGME